MRNEMPMKTSEMKKSLSDMVELANDVAAGNFIPKKFRKAPFTKVLREKYVHYLNKEIEYLSNKINALEKPRVVKPVKVKPKNEVTN